MPAINHAPTPREFATGWTVGFAAAVRAAGGRDGRLSRNEAKKIGNLAPCLARYADNAQNYLQRTGQSSVSIEKLIGAGYNYALATAEKANVQGNTVSLVEARALPDDIRGDFFALRGEAEPNPRAEWEKRVRAELWRRRDAQVPSFGLRNLPEISFDGLPAAAQDTIKLTMAWGFSGEDAVWDVRRLDIDNQSAYIVEIDADPAGMFGGGVQRYCFAYDGQRLTGTPFDTWRRPDE